MKHVCGSFLFYISLIVSIYFKFISIYFELLKTGTKKKKSVDRF
jgi:hypothetical protein